MRVLICGWLASLILLLPTPGGAQNVGTTSRAGNHPLSGRIWDVRAEQFVDAPELERRLAMTQFVLLGETHDNAEHHRLQHGVIAALVRSGRRPAIAMEQFDREHQHALDGARAERPYDSNHLKQKAKFNDQGWQWDFYEPIVALALKYDMPLIAANLSRADAFRVASAGLDSLGANQISQLGLDQPLEAARRERLERVMHEGHCEKAPLAALAGMVDAQRARDAVMAHALAAHRARGAVLIAGNGHIRRDFGVPYHLERFAPGASISSVALVEARADRLRPEDYRADRNSEFDYLWFTSATARDDPCLRLQFKPK